MPMSTSHGRPDYCVSGVSGNILPLIALVCVCLDGHKAQLQCCNNSRLYISLSYWSYSDI